jgi:hypothetical protein
MGQVWWFTPIIPTLGRLRQENHEFETSLGYIARPVSDFKKAMMVEDPSSELGSEPRLVWSQSLSLGRDQRTPISMC